MTSPELNSLPLARGTHDRAAHLRANPAALAKAWAHPQARVLRVHGGATALRADGADLAYLTVDQVKSPEDAWFLGLDTAARPYFALAGEFEPGPDERAATLRELTGALSADAVGLFVHAVGLDNWHARHGFCPNCGSPSTIVSGGHVRACTGCAMQQFPRTDPAVIMLVVDDDDRCLLGHNPAWPPGRFSTLAGFVEPGESLEQAVIREVYEEVGVVCDRVVYEGSQPWPLPSSLMLGFRAHAVDTTTTVDAEEITEARWFTREELLEAGRTGEALMPGAISIARYLIENWFGGPLPAENRWQ
ncbi:MAG: NAD(+) diphosphatase [Sporichthyaceae bacterium]